ncbi:MAG: 2-oxoacid:acceptor oxidoreductase family protein, partial [Candidatus Bipolaricaulota bacterium]
MHEIKFSGRGGQGVVVASQLLGFSLFKAGMYPQCYSVFGGERRGAPVVSFLRVDKDKILLKSEIKAPNDLICFDENQFDADMARALLKPGGRILVNTRRDANELGDLEGFSVGSIDALEISRASGMGDMINTTVLGAYSRMNDNVGLEYLLEAISEMVPAKHNENQEAARRAYEAVV